MSEHNPSNVAADLRAIIQAQEEEIAALRERAERAEAERRGYLRGLRDAREMTAGWIGTEPALRDIDRLITEAEGEWK